VADALRAARHKPTGSLRATALRLLARRDYPRAALESIARVAERVRRGGHNIPESVIRRRFDAGRRNFEQHYRKVADARALYDNSGEEPILIEWGEAP